MEAAAVFSSSFILTSTPLNTKTLSRNRVIITNICSRSKSRASVVGLVKNQRRIAAISDVSAVADSSQVQIKWQIIVGAIAGVTPFIVAGIEFSKRIIAQRRCEVCRGSGLVLREKDYFRCPGCGGFLPWQSLKRFFSG